MFRKIITKVWPPTRPTDGLLPAIPAKQGHNDLSRWEAFGGALPRPASPAPINVKHAGEPTEPMLGGFPDGCFNSLNCTTPNDCLMWGCVKGHGTPPRPPAPVQVAPGMEPA